MRNGERWISRKLESILQLDYPRELMEVLVISDGSDDRTDDLVREFSRRANIQLIGIPKGGKAAALNADVSEPPDSCRPLRCRFVAEGTPAPRPCGHEALFFLAGPKAKPGQAFRRWIFPAEWCECNGCALPQRDLREPQWALA